MLMVVGCHISAAVLYRLSITDDSEFCWLANACTLRLRPLLGWDLSSSMFYRNVRTDLPLHAA